MFLKHMQQITNLGSLSKLLHCLESAIVLLQFNDHTFLLLLEF